MMYLAQEQPDLEIRKTSVNLALDYSKHVAKAEFQAPSDFLNVAQMFYDYLTKGKSDDRK